MMQQLRTSWQALSAKEQNYLRVAGVVLALILFRSLIWQPVHQYRTDQQLAEQTAHQQLQWLTERLPMLGTSNGPTRSGSLNEVVAQTANQFNITVSRMQPLKEQLQLSVEDVPFSQLLQWLETLQTQHGVTLQQLDIATTETAGVVRVRRLVLE